MLDLVWSIDGSLHGCFRGGCWKLYRDGYDERGERYNLRDLQRHNANGAFAQYQSDLRPCRDSGLGFRVELPRYHLYTNVFPARPLQFSDMFNLEWCVNWKLHGRLKRVYRRLHGDGYN
jgi:hypothetical protein